MVDPKRHLYKLSEEDRKFTEECDELFKDRYTEKDLDFQEYCEKPSQPPPIVDPWSTQRRQYQSNDRHGDSYRSRNDGYGNQGGGGGRGQHNNRYNNRYQPYNRGGGGGGSRGGDRDLPYYKRDSYQQNNSYQNRDRDHNQRRPGNDRESIL